MAMPRLDLSSGFKHCRQCDQRLPLEHFSKSSSTVHGYQTYCRKCSYARFKTYAEKPENKARFNKRLREARKKNPEIFRDYDLRSRMKLEPGTYQRMYDAQNGKCAICAGARLSTGKFRLHIDHCHDTGIIRGLLCHNCNVGIGNLRHDENIMHRAIDYLKKHQP